MTNDRRPQRTAPPPIPPRKRDRPDPGASSSKSLPNVTMPLDSRDIIAALDDVEDEPTPTP